MMVQLSMSLSRSRFMRGLSLAVTGLAALATAGVTPLAIAADSVSISRDWRFAKGDPAGLTTDLRYDVRPPIDDAGDGKLADTPADAAVKVDDGGAQVLKPWILPSANPFIKDAAKHHVRPAGNPGGDVPYVQAHFDDSAWTKVDLPHDWAIAGPFIKDGPYGGMGRLPSWGIGWYRRTLDIPARDKGKSIFLDVEGAMSYATVWLNGKLVGGWPYGYNSFRLDLTPYAVPGSRNQLAIRLDNPQASARWYPGGGLYRDIYLTTANKVHVGQWGGTVRTPQVSKAQATIDLSLTLDNDGDKVAQVEVATALYALDTNGKRTGRPVATIARQSASIAPGAKAVLNGSTILTNPRLWGPPPTQQPNRYIALSTVTQGGRTIDTYETRFGVRDIQFDPDKGAIVNGEHIPLRGVNNHHDLGAIGAAFNRRAAQRQLEILRDMGANAVRMSHNPPAPELLELTDQMGFLVMDEIFDSWEKKKTPHDFHLIFPDWHEADLRSMLRRDRNHPSIIMWSVGNEVGEQYDGEAGAKIGRELIAIAHEEDPTRLATGAMNFAKADMLLPTTVDVISLNYQGAGIRGIIGQYPAFRAKFPDKVILSTESASALSSRGEYMFPVAGAISGPVRPWSGGNPDTHQVSAYELHAADFGSSPDRVWAADDQNPYVAGEFVWTGFDYLGEPTPYYTSRSSYSGIVDLAGFPKDRFWLYQARWRPDLKFAHILPHWSWPDRVGQITPVHVFSSADAAELFVNGQSQGKIKKRDYEYRFRWDYVVYAPGEVKVVTWKDDKPWATETVRTVGEAAKLSLTADRSTIADDGRDLSFVTLKVLDRDGHFVPAAKQTISFTIEGPGQIVATDNGDPTDLNTFPSHSRAAFNGLALAIVKANRPGKIILRAHAEGLGETQVAISAKR
ncbi:Beta-galactosidase BoGH2A [Sphingobium sp. AntQ-1]|uniref:beta-galactosidase GalB n=1 Tax=Sphingobium sp. AntQ-1 TaxID=2930091 RepID=UPI00234EC34D|nr:beta-galactosidase GalB [Sphingobium sp. AntQ-1]WCP15288.1 Beta-galactosidase BoGH2A [Sphingobium sp. AntQ-1]